MKFSNLVYRKILNLVISILVFIFFSCLAFWFEEDFRKLIRYLYVLLSDGNISFALPRKHFHFPSGLFVSSFGIFMVAIFQIVSRTPSVKTFRMLLLGFILSIGFVFGYVYVDGLLKIAVCTMCDDGILALYINNVNYDLIFVVSLSLILLPMGIKSLVSRKRLFELKKYF